MGASFEGHRLIAAAAFGLRRGHLFAMANRHSDLFGPICRSDDDLDAVLLPVARGPWSRITMRALPVDDVTDRLEAILGADGWLVHRTPHEVCPVVDTREPFDAYERRLTRNARKQIGRGRRRLEAAGRMEMGVLVPVERLDPLLDECLRLEAAGWKGRAGAAIVSSPAANDFWRDVFGRFHQLGGLRVSWLRLDGSLIAMSIDVVHARRLYLLKTSYDERLARFSPGHVLYAEMIRAACDGAIDAHELLGPTSAFKERYATSSRKTCILRAYRRRPAPAIRYVGRRLLVPGLRSLRRAGRGARERRTRRPPKDG